ncbi:MAG: DUF6283 family protein [Bordetella sp.]|nr:DUF6283 family protein [Bordetella sp.]
MAVPKPPQRPCPSCPWRVDQGAKDIPHFSLPLAEQLARTCPDERGHGPDFGAPLFACHQSRPGAEVHCAGWLASVGHAHPGVRLAITSGRLDPGSLAPEPDWPRLHTDYAQVLEKLRRTADPPAREAEDTASTPR